jgi:hypothetical protein
MGVWDMLFTLVAELPNPIQKRDILYGVKKTTSENLRALAQEFMAQGWLSDSLDFSAYSSAKDLLAQVKSVALKEGNTFLYLKSVRLLGDNEIDKNELQVCAQNAEQNQLWRYAIMAYEKLGIQEKVDSIKANQIANDGDILQEAKNKVFIPTHSEELEGSELESDIESNS